MAQIAAQVIEVDNQTSKSADNQPRSTLLRKQTSLVSYYYQNAWRLSQVEIASQVLQWVAAPQVYGDSGSDILLTLPQQEHIAQNAQQRMLDLTRDRYVTFVLPSTSTVQQSAQVYAIQEQYWQAFSEQNDVVPIDYVNYNGPRRYQIKVVTVAGIEVVLYNVTWDNTTTWDTNYEPDPTVTRDYVQYATTQHGTAEYADSAVGVAGFPLFPSPDKVPEAVTLPGSYTLGYTMDRMAASTTSRDVLLLGALGNLIYLSEPKDITTAVDITDRVLQTATLPFTGEFSTRVLSVYHDGTEWILAVEAYAPGHILAEAEFITCSSYCSGVATSSDLQHWTFVPKYQLYTHCTKNNFGVTPGAFYHLSISIAAQDTDEGVPGEDIVQMVWVHYHSPIVFLTTKYDNIIGNYYSPTRALSPLDVSWNGTIYFGFTDDGVLVVSRYPYDDPRSPQLPVGPVLPFMHYDPARPSQLIQDGPTLQGVIVKPQDDGSPGFEGNILAAGPGGACLQVKSYPGLMPPQSLAFIDPFQDKLAGPLQAGGVLWTWHAIPDPLGMYYVWLLDITIVVGGVQFYDGSTWPSSLSGWPGRAYTQEFNSLAVGAFSDDSGYNPNLRYGNQPVTIGVDKNTQTLVVMTVADYVNPTNPNIVPYFALYRHVVVPTMTEHFKSSDRPLPYDRTSYGFSIRYAPRYMPPHGSAQLAVEVPNDPQHGFDYVNYGVSSQDGNFDFYDAIGLTRRVGWSGESQPGHHTIVSWGYSYGPSNEIFLIHKSGQLQSNKGLLYRFGYGKNPPIWINSYVCSTTQYPTGPAYNRNRGLLFVAGGEGHPPLVPYQTKAVCSSFTDGTLYAIDLQGNLTVRIATSPNGTGYADTWTTLIPDLVPSSCIVLLMKFATVKTDTLLVVHSSGDHDNQAGKFKQVAVTTVSTTNPGNWTATTSKPFDFDCDMRQFMQFGGDNPRNLLSSGSICGACEVGKKTS